MSVICATITLTRSPWIIVAVGTWMVALVLLLWSYRRVPDWGLGQKCAFALKLLGLLILVLCLIEPLWSSRRARPGANVVAVVADNSQGMTILDPGWNQRRSEVEHTYLAGDKAGWLGTLEEQFRVRRYRFDNRLHRSVDFNDLSFDGPSSSLQTSLKTLAARYHGRPLAGIVLLTDGNPTDLDTGSLDTNGLPPVYPVVMGSDRGPRDLALTQVTVTQTAFEDAPVTIEASTSATGWAGRTVHVAVRDQQGVLVQQQPWKVRQDTEHQVFRFRLRPTKTGVLFYRVTLTAEDQDLDEATRANNERSVVVDRGQGPYRVLYVAGRPNWEYKFLHRAVSEDQQVNLVGLIRVAKREPKYDWRGRQGEQSNPLYRGSKQVNQEQTEQYDQPVIVRLNTRDKNELSGGFPKQAEELFAYDALILDDVDAGFFTRDQLDLIRRFVSERGGGFLMLGGQESFQRGKFQHTPVGSLLPVYLDRLPTAPVGKSMRLNLTREGWLAPWVRLHDTEQAEQQRLHDMPDFQVVNRLTAVKPGAQVMATVGDGAGDSYPAVVVQRFGRGRSAAVTVGDIWRWGLRNASLRVDQNKFWRQMVRWLVADVPQRVELTARPAVDSAQETVQLTVHVAKKDYRPMDNVQVHLKVIDPQGQAADLLAEPADNERGTFHAFYVPRHSGGYTVQATVTGQDGTAVGRAEAGWAQDLEAREFRSLVPNRALLTRLAQQTGGRVLALSDLESFARNLPQRDVPVTEVWVRPLWDLPGALPIILVLVLSCFGLEWALRRRKGLP